MKQLSGLPFDVWLGHPEDPVADGFRSHPDTETLVWSPEVAVDAEWDRTPPGVPTAVFFHSDSEKHHPFWLCHTAKEALYKREFRPFPFVPAAWPVDSVTETCAASRHVLRRFDWQGGCTCLTRVPGNTPGTERLLWVSMAPGQNPKRDLTSTAASWKTPHRSLLRKS